MRVQNFLLLQAAGFRGDVRQSCSVSLRVLTVNPATVPVVRRLFEW